MRLMLLQVLPEYHPPGFQVDYGNHCSVFSRGAMEQLDGQLPVKNDHMQTLQLILYRLHCIADKVFILAV